MREQFTAVVHENQSLCREHYRLRLRLADFPATEPGQFVQVACRDLDLNYSPEREFDWSAGNPLAAPGRELLSPLAMLRRPFSLAGRRQVVGQVELELIHRIVGVGTKWLSELCAGDRVHVLGPLGNTFRLPNENEVALMVGGGVGIPPMLYLATKLAGRRAVAFSGALSRDLLPLTITDDAPASAAARGDALYNIAEFAAHGIPAVITTDDGSYGFQGFVTQALENYLDKYFPARVAGGLTPVIYTCGPEGMMKRVADIARKRGIECQVAVERAMACGMGTCQSCCIRLERKPTDLAGAPSAGSGQAGRDWVYKLACTDGPVFLGSELLW